MISASFGKGKKGSPGDPQEFDSIEDFAQAIREHASIKKFPLDIDKDEYKSKKDRGPWVMRAIDEATAFDEEKNDWHRRRGSVTTVDWLMFDGDKMPYGSYARVRKALKEEGFDFLMYKSTGHNLECKDELEAFRVIIPCEPVAGEIAEAVSAHYREDFLESIAPGGEWDPACDQPTRVIYLPFADAPVDVFEGSINAFDCAEYFTDYALTLVKKNRDGMERGEADVGSYGTFIDWCLSNVDDAILIQKPDGRVALQMPGQQPDKYSGGEDGGDGWNFYLPSGDYEMMVFHSLHELTEPEKTFKIQDAVNVLARRYGSEPAQHYGQGMREAMATADGRAEVSNAIASAFDVMTGSDQHRRATFDDLPECGAAPTGYEMLTPAAFSAPEANEWPADIGWDLPEEPVEPGPDADEEEILAFQEAEADYANAIMEWDRQYQANKIERFQYFNRSFCFVADGSLVANLNRQASTKPLRLRDWLTMMLPFTYWGTDDKGKAKMFGYADTWLKSEHRQTAFGVEYAPGLPRVFNNAGDQVLNRFYIEPFEYTEADDLLAKFFWLVDRTHPIAKERELFLDWLAFSFRYPQERILWAYVNISQARGSGRGTLKKIIETLMGHHNVKATDVNMVDRDQYHDWAHECLVTVIEEADEKANGGRVKISGHWNEAITAHRRMLNLKYGSNGSHTLYNNMVFFLNEASIIIDPEDRRINATTGAPAGIDPITKEQAAEIHRMIADPEFRDQLASFLWRRDLTDFDATRSDKTLPARETLLAQSTSVNEEAVEDLIEKLPSMVVPVSMIHQAANKILDGSKILKADAVVKILQSRVVAKEVVSCKGQGSHRCWVFDDYRNHPRGWKSEELAKCFKSFMKRGESDGA